MIYCGDITCKYNEKNKCKSKNIELSYHGVNTMYMGFQDFLKCKTHKTSEQYEELKEKLKECLSKES